MADWQAMALWALLWALFLLALVVVIVWRRLIEWIMSKSAWRDKTKIRENGRWRRKSE